LVDTLAYFSLLLYIEFGLFGVYQYINTEVTLNIGIIRQSLVNHSPTAKTQKQTNLS